MISWQKTGLSEQGFLHNFDDENIIFKEMIEVEGSQGGKNIQAFRTICTQIWGRQYSAINH